MALSHFAHAGLSVEPTRRQAGLSVGPTRLQAGLSVGPEPARLQEGRAGEPSRLHAGPPRGPFRLTGKTFGARTTLAVTVHLTTVFTVQPIETDVLREDRPNHGRR